MSIATTALVCTALLSAAAAALTIDCGATPTHRLRALAPHSDPRLRVSYGSAVAAAVMAVILFGFAGLTAVASGLVVRAIWARDAPARRRKAIVDAARRAGPLAYDLLATCAAVGLSVPVGARVVAASVSLPLAPHLSRFAAALERGAPMEEAATTLSAAGLGEFADTLVAAESGGPGLAAALSALAAETRAIAAANATASAKRAGVWAVGPLTLCFLPAFVLVGVVPMVAALLGGVLR